MIRLLAIPVAFVLGWWLGRDHEYREWIAACQTPEPEPETTNVDPVPLSFAEAVRVLTRDWNDDLKHEWEYNR